MTFQLKEAFYAGYRAISPNVICSRETKAELTKQVVAEGLILVGGLRDSKATVRCLKEEANETVVGPHGREAGLVCGAVVHVQRQTPHMLQTSR